MVCGVLIAISLLPFGGSLEDDMQAPRELVGDLTTRGNILYVGPGQTYSYIQDAIDAASYGDTVFVYYGIYNETIKVKEGIKLIGETPNRPVLDGKNIPEIRYGRVPINASSNVLIEGFNITNGYYGITAHQCVNLTITRNVFRNLDFRGIRFWNWTESVVSNNIFFNASIALDIAVHSGDSQSSITIRNNVFNYCERGIWCPAGKQIVHNNIFTNCDLAVNHPSTSEGTWMSNNLFWNNYQDYAGSGGKKGDIKADPQFTDYMYHVSWDSPAVDAGNNDYMPTLDFDGTARPVDADGDGRAEVDIGVYEKVRSVQNFYVDDNVAPGGDGSISKPFSKIQDAIDNATSGDFILVSSGVYEEKLFLKDGMRLIGEMPNRPILDGTNIPWDGYRTMITTNHDVLIEGFIIKQGEYGIRNIGDKNVTISRNIITETNWTSVQCSGGGETIISNNIFYNTKDAIRSNTGTIKWGRLPPYDIVANNVFDNCYSGVGGDGIEKIVNNIFVNCTWAITFCSTPGNNISNNLFWNNANDYFETAEGQNNITENPMFIDSSYHISWESPAIDNGSDFFIPSNDFDGEIRPFDGDFDGRYEVDVGIDEKSQNTLYVDDNAAPGGNGSVSNPYNKIQDAIDNAATGYTIYVHPGTYFENILVDKTLNLVGLDTKNTIIHGNFFSSVVSVEADWCNITGFNITQSGDNNNDAGISLRSDNNRVQDCIVIDNQYGIFIQDSINNNITDCILRANGAEGIFLSGTSNYNILSNNIFIFNTGYGVYIDLDCNYNSIFNNNFIGNALEIECPSCPQAFDNGKGNNWNTSKAGNFWFGWSTPDMDNDSIVDLAYSISGSAMAKDYYPLVNKTEEIIFEPPDVFPPTISKMSIADNATNFPVTDSEIQITFDEPMNRTSVESALSIQPIVKYSLIWNDNSTILRILFTEKLSYNTSYTIFVNLTAKDVLGNYLRSPLKLNFTTIFESKAVEKEKPPPWENLVFFVGILISVILIIILVFVFITKSRRKRKEVEKKELAKLEARREYYSGKIAEEYYYPEFKSESDEFIWNLAHETLSVKKPSDFGPPKNKILEKLELRYRKGEISRTTFESISAELSRAGAD